MRDGERGREKRWRERVWRWFLSRTVIFGFDHHPKSTRDILRYRYWSYLHKVISRRLQILKSLVRRYFYFPTVSGAHDLCSNNSDVFHNNSQWPNKLGCIKLGRLAEDKHSSLLNPFVSYYGKPHGYSSRSDSTRKAVAKQTSPKINRLC